MFKADDYRLRIKSLTETLDEAAYALDIENQKLRREEILAQQQKEEVWNNLELSAKLGRELSVIENKIHVVEDSRKAITDAAEIIDLIEETGEEDLIAELDELLKTAEEEIEETRIRALLRGKYDTSNALLSLHSGAGGTEACDWTSMLYRMYCRYCEGMGFKVFELDREAGDEAGIKRVDFRVEGVNAYGFLKAEMGVHRLVRISPFDSNKRRHTSFASLEVMPQVEDNDEVQIDEKEIRIDIYHSGGAGGQNVNKVATAVRITHYPTGIVVQCQNERSQLQNKEMCFEMLRAKLLEKKIQERQAEDNALKGDVKKIEWGSQIRSYVFCPYTMVKDHRTGYEKGDVQSVMDGEIQEFIIDYLKKV
ncbi:MAG: peptide chain release factor 2 [Clostridia bacterium]|nr:peptide chain release factor 2 [Clostridia bacterium]